GRLAARLGAGTTDEGQQQARHQPSVVFHGDPLVNARAGHALRGPCPCRIGSCRWDAVDRLCPPPCQERSVLFVFSFAFISDLLFLVLLGFVSGFRFRHSNLVFPMDVPDLPSAVQLEQPHLRLPSRPDWVEAAVEYLKEKAILAGACQESRTNKLMVA